MTIKVMTMTFHFNQRIWWYICIFADTQNQTKNAKEPPSQRTTTDQMTGQLTDKQEGRTAKKVLPKAGLNGFDWTFMQGSKSVLRLNFCAKNPRLRQYPKRYA